MIADVREQFKAYMVSDFEEITLRAGQADKHVAQVSRMIYTVSDSGSMGSLSVLSDVDIFKTKFLIPNLEEKKVELVPQ